MHFSFQKLPEIASNLDHSFGLVFGDRLKLRILTSKLAELLISQCPSIYTIETLRREYL